jgi:hypothetical protein
MQDEYLLVLNSPPALEEEIVDWLLACDCLGGFTSLPVSGHSSKLTGLSVAEQVRGQRGRVQFQIHAPRQALLDQLAKLKRDFAGSDLHYWLMPLVAAGHLGADD